MARKVSWSALKDRQARLSLPFDWVEEDNFYVVKIFTLNDDFESTLEKDGNPDTIDFETNYKNNPQTIGSNNNSISVDVVAQNIIGSKWRTEIDTADISLPTNSYITLKSLTNGTLTSLIVDFNTDRVDIKINIDGTDILDVDLDELENAQVGGTKDGTADDIICVKTGSKFVFRPPHGLTYTNLVISAKAEVKKKRMTNLLINYIVGG